ncbi:MAG: RIP metalloprotease RseP [candidate division Zixibacteria bacterium]|nr:RIP metalloprotease RseP [candidate division Zixibacteria bacterium]
MILTILATIFVLGVLVFFHELGHFLVAKKAGIRVEKFSLGFPPKLISRKWGDTEYAIGAIPLGGYVKMAGEQPGEEASGAPWEFMSKPVWKRALVIFAGPLMNFILAVLVLTGLYLVRGKEVDRVYIGSVGAGSPAEKAGIQSGDLILSVEGIEVKTFQDMAGEIYKRVEQPVVITLERDGIVRTDTIVTYKDFAVTSEGDSVAVGKIGVGNKPVFERLGFISAIGAGVNQSIFYVEKVIEFVGGLITRQVTPSEIGGPILIGQIAGATARAGFDILLEFLALLSVNLAVLNILPIPLLDGGHLIFLLAEKVKGSPISLKTRLVIQQVGIAFLLLLVIFVTFNDITR